MRGCPTAGHERGTGNLDPQAAHAFDWRALAPNATTGLGVATLAG
jgi:hypothetical protein